MKFCPDCGSKRDEKDLCECGFNFITGESPVREVTSHANIDQHVFSIKDHLTGVSLEELKRGNLDLGYLLSYGVVTAGGMMGQYYQAELSFETNELTVNNREWHHGEETKKVYKVDEDTSKEIKEGIIENNLRAWSELPINNSMIAYDAPSSSVYLKFEEKTVYINTLVYMNDEESEIFKKYRYALGDLQIEENKISEEVITQGLSMMDLMMKSKPDTRLCKDCGAVLKDDEKICSLCGSKND